jgi:outer membrane protein TolC/ABC-type uncharacterized transport system substrate-binding protein
MKSTSILIVFIICLFNPLILSQTNNKPVVTIGLLLDGGWESNEMALNELEKQTKTLLEDEYDVHIPESKIIDGNWNIDQISAGLDQLLDDPDVNIIIAYGEVSSSIAVFREKFSKPVIAAIAINSELENMPLRDGTSGINNLNYISFTSNLESQIPQMKELYNFNKAALLVNRLFFENQKYMNLNPEVDFVRTIHGVELVYVPVGVDYEELFSKIPDDVQVIISSPLRSLKYDQADDIFSRFTQKGIPVFTYFDEKYVRGEVLAGFILKDFFPRISRRIALNIQSILLGENAGDLPVKFPVDQEFLINMHVAEQMKIYPSWSLMNNSKLINYTTDEVSRVLNIYEVIDNAIESNLDLLAERRRIESGEQDVKIARSFLLPQLDVSATGTLIDEDRAETGFGQVSEQMIVGDLTLDQLIYDVDAWANLDINSLNQELRINELEQAELDLIREASISYINILVAKTIEQINRDNLALSKSNMEIAKFRVNVGSANLTEIYRWESEIANNLKAVIQANADRNVGEINLNQLLNRPSEEKFELDEASLDQLVSLVAGDRVIKYYQNKWDFKIFREFMVQEAFVYSPELKVIDKAIEIQQRISTAANTQFFLPTIGLQGQLANTFYRGAGSEIEPITIPGVGDFEFGTIPKDFSWGIGLNLRLPLFEGAGRFAEVEQSSIEVKKLKLEKKSLKNKIEQGVRSALHQSGSSYAGMKQAKISSDASAKNLRIVIDLYSKGFASITDLLDAQNAALIAELLATSAQFNFFIDMINVQRAAGEFVFNAPAEVQDEFINRLEDYYEKNTNN